MINLDTFHKKFPCEDSARMYFEQKRWPKGINCPHCSSFYIAKCKNDNPMPYRCKACRKHFSVRTSTILSKSPLSFTKWLLAMYILTKIHKNIPAYEIANMLNVSEKTALSITDRIHKKYNKKIAK